VAEKGRKADASGGKGPFRSPFPHILVLFSRRNIRSERHVLKIKYVSLQAVMTEYSIGESHRPGRIEVVCGSMFSGKTEELIRRLKRAKFAKQRVEIFKPIIDTRYSEGDVVSHDHNAIHSTPVESSQNILLASAGYDVVGIDEAQFLDNGLVDVCNRLAYKGVRVIVAGLDMDYRGVPFGPIPALCAIADEVTKVHAICVKCGALAYASHRLVKSDKQVLLGEKTEYEPLCRDCFKRALDEDRRNAQSKDIFENI
jgi:thymidine kinase